MIAQSSTGIFETTEQGRNFDANEPDAGVLCCLTCYRQIPENAWFARIKLGTHRAVFCRPGCMELFLDDPAKYVHRFVE